MHRSSPIRCGHTLIELVAAMVSGVVLLAGLGAVMMIGRQIAYTPSASLRGIEASRTVNDLADELRFATFIAEHTSTAIEFALADRDGDNAAERIRYEWSGTPGDPLLRTYNGGTPASVSDAVQNFQCSLAIDSKDSTFTATTDTAESVLAASATVVAGAVRDVNVNSFTSQRIDAAAISAGAPSGAVSWNATKVDFYGSSRILPNETLRVQIRSGGDPSGNPTGQVLGEVAIPEGNLNAVAGWNTATFPSPIRNLALHRSHAVVWRGTAGDAADACRLTVNDATATGVNQSDDAGASWYYMPGRQTFFRVYGTYTSPGTAYNVTRSYATRATILLQPDTAPHSRIDASIPLDNTPELLSAYWRTDFTTDPTTLDATGDGVADWSMAGGSPFDTAGLNGGIWSATGALESRPLNDFINVTTVESRCRNTTVGGNGAVVRINADRQGGLHAPLFVSLRLQADGSQTLTLYGKSGDAADVRLFERKRLAPDFVTFRLTILPASDVVNLAIDDEDQGTFSYPRYAPSAENRFVTFFADTSSAAFDYVEVGVAESN